MRVFRWRPALRGARVWFTAWLAAVAIVLATVVPVLAVRTPVRLADAAVTPGSVTQGEMVTFRVTYRNLDGVDAASVRAEFAGKSYALSPGKSKKNVRAGVRFEATVAPSPGSGPVSFVATDLLGRSVSLAAGRLTVEALPPPVDAGGTDPGGTGAGIGTPGGSGAGSSGSGSSGSGSSSTSTPSGSGTGSTEQPGSSASQSPSPSGATSGGAASDDVAAPRDADRAGGLLADPPTAPEPATGLPPRVPAEPDTATIDPAATDVHPSRAGSTGRSRSSHPDTAASFAAAAIVGLRPAPDPLTAVLPVLVTSLGGATMLMAFMVFGKRRRDGEPTDSDMALATAAATGSGAVASAALVDAPAGFPVRPGMPTDAEMAMPRWRRPSLLEARKTDPLRTATAPAISLSFDHGLVDPVEGRERRRIRYRVVRLLDSPDELTALDVGVLDAGDEVQLLERSGVYWFVLCPDGQRGWVHKMVLGDVVEEPEDVPGPGARATGLRETGDEALAARLAAVDAPAAIGPAGGSEPGGYDAGMAPAAWTMRGTSAADAGLDVDDDVMRAFLAAQRRG